IASLGPVRQVSVKPALSAVPTSRLLAIALLALLALAVNAWFLFPDLAYSNKTIIAGRIQFFDWGGYFAKPSNWLNPLRSLPPDHIEYFRALSRDTGIETAPNSMYTQLPVFTLLWLAASSCLLIPRNRMSKSFRAWIAQVVVLGVFIFLTADQGIWHSFPKLLRFTQFSMRLNTFVLLAIAGLVLTTLVWLERVGYGARAL